MLEDNTVKTKLDSGTDLETNNSSTKIHSFKKVSKLSAFVYKHFRIIILLEILVVLILGYFLVIKVKLSETKHYEELVQQQQRELTKMKDYRNRALELEKKYKIMEQEAKEDIDKLYNILPPKEDLPNLMAQIEALTLSHNFVLGSITMSSGSDNSLAPKKSVLASSKNTNSSSTDLIKDVNINVFIVSDDGGYERIKELLDAFEHHIRFTDIISVSFDQDMKSCSIMLKTYYLDYAK